MFIPTIILKSLFLIPIFILGIVTSYSDIKYGKIKNSHLLWGGLYVLCLYIFLIIYSLFFLHQTDNLKYVAELLLNGVIAFIISYLLWRFNLWAAGDAKLFILYSLLIPPEFYSKNYIPYFPSAIFLIDTFLIIGLFFFLKMLIKGIKLGLKSNIKLSSFVLYLSRINYKNLYKNLKNNILKIGKTFLFITSMIIILQYIQTKTDIIYLKVLSNPFVFYLLFFALQMFFFKNLTKNKLLSIIIILIGVICGFTFIYTNKTIELINIIKNSVLLMIFMSFSIQLVYFYIDNYEIKKIAVKNLYAGCFLTSKSLLEVKNKIKEQNQENSANFLINSDGLTKSQVHVIQKLFKNEPEKTLEIYETFSFAPFMFLAFIIFFVSKMSFLSYLGYFVHLIK